MKKIIIVSASAFLVLAILFAGAFSLQNHAVHASAAKTRPGLFALEHQHGKAGGLASTSSFSYNCTASGGVKGNLIMNVTEKVINDADSGQAGDYWALDALTRTIKIYNIGADSYCAAVNYPVASFAAIAGQQSPGSVGGNGGLLTGDEIGTFKGSAQFLITGQLDVIDPTNWPVSGSINGGNPVNYQCDSSGNCPGYVSFIGQYFAVGVTFTEPQWGWKYIGKDCCAPDAGTSNGVWVNAATGNSGDILDVD